ncbi:hypothetical protein F7725_006406 [Dissostichus mawsoni]|uniref:Kazal-like domain-containing protein n=1 Tax=Dissostichus mawsoni TaxID=36200 RepID=A0A7J5XTU1_DISMA|nr:hypothetical protein F7725_006406 [Dissostichus mawsoni]
MGANDLKMNPDPAEFRPPTRRRSLFYSVKFFVFCHSLLQLAQLLVGNTILIVFVSFLGSRVHRPRCIAGGALLACLASLIMSLRTSWEGCTSTQTALNSCSGKQGGAHQEVYPLLLMGQLLLGIGAVPIQPFGISYIDDHASRKNSPLYLGILLAVTSIGPAFGFISGSLMLRFYVDFDKLSKDQIELNHKDLRWVGAWWLGFLVAKRTRTWSFPRIALRTLRSPIYLLVVLAQVNLAALLAGLATFMSKFIERQSETGFLTQTITYLLPSSLSVWNEVPVGRGVCIPLAVLGTVLGGVLMRRLSLSVGGASKLCTAAILLCILSSTPLLFIGCSTQTVAEVFPQGSAVLSCSTGCRCPTEAFNPVCGSDGVEFRSPCHAGCSNVQIDASNKPTVSASPLRGLVAVDAQTSCSLRGSAGHHQLHRLLLPDALPFMPGPVLYGSVIDSTCISWGRKCDKKTSCQYYDLDRFRQREGAGGHQNLKTHSERKQGKTLNEAEQEFKENANVEAATLTKLQFMLLKLPNYVGLLNEDVLFVDPKSLNRVQRRINDFIIPSLCL